MAPDEFWGMTMIEFACACDGFQKFHSADDSSAPMSRDELEDLMERYPDYWQQLIELF